jgi:hypothetical protein
VVEAATCIDGMRSLRNSQPRTSHIHKSITNFGIVGQSSEPDTFAGAIHALPVNGSHAFMTEAQRLCEEAERCMRLAEAIADERAARGLVTLASEYLETAQRLVRRRGLSVTIAQPPG